MEKIKTIKVVELEVIRKHLLTVNDSLTQRLAHIDYVLKSPLMDNELIASYSGEKQGLLTAQNKIYDLLYSLL